MKIKLKYLFVLTAIVAIAVAFVVSARERVRVAKAEAFSYLQENGVLLVTKDDGSDQIIRAEIFVASENGIVSINGKELNSSDATLELQRMKQAVKTIETNCVFELGDVSSIDVVPGMEPNLEQTKKIRGLIDERIDAMKGKGPLPRLSPGPDYQERRNEYQRSNLLFMQDN